MKDTRSLLEGLSGVTGLLVSSSPFLNVGPDVTPSGPLDPQAPARLVAGRITLALPRPTPLAVVVPAEEGP